MSEIKGTAGYGNVVLTTQSIVLASVLRRKVTGKSVCREGGPEPQCPGRSPKKSKAMWTKNLHGWGTEKPEFTAQVPELSRFFERGPLWGGPEEFPILSAAPVAGS